MIDKQAKLNSQNLKKIDFSEWIIPCNVKYYDVIGAFNELNNIEWKQSVGIKVNDIVYIYVGNPYKEIKYKCIAKKVDLDSARGIDDSKFIRDSSTYENTGRYMELELLQKYGEQELPLNLLKEKGIKSVQGPSRIPEQLSSYISSIGEVILIPVAGSIDLVKKIEDKDKIDYVELDIEDINLNIELAEGESITRLVEIKKRNSLARNLKLDNFKEVNGKVYCEVCGIDDEVVLDVHHDKVSVANMKDGHVTKLEDLRVICANCHRKVHGLKVTVDRLIEINKRI